MKRKVRFAVSILSESVIDVPDHIAKRPEERAWLAAYLKKPAKLVIPAFEEAPLIGMVVGQPADDMSDWLLHPMEPEDTT